MPRGCSVQVTVNDEVRHRLESLASASGLSVSSYVRVLINRHFLALDRHPQSLPSLHDIYSQTPGL
jgi:hypothetical protein